MANPWEMDWDAPQGGPIMGPPPKVDPCKSTVVALMTVTTQLLPLVVPVMPPTELTNHLCPVAMLAVVSTVRRTSPDPLLTAPETTGGATTC